VRVKCHENPSFSCGQAGETNLFVILQRKYNNNGDVLCQDTSVYSATSVNVIQTGRCPNPEDNKKFGAQKMLREQPKSQFTVY